MNDDRDDELTALLATHRPDPAAFARGVAARLRERETRMAAPAPRRAAGVTPLDLGAVASSNGVLLSAPLLVVSMVAAAFAACFRGLRHTIARSSARTTTAAERRAVGARIFGIGWTMAMFVVMSYFWFAPQWFQGTGLAVVALLAAIGLVFAVGRHARSGIDRALVATLGIGILEVILAIGVSWFVAEPSSSPAQWRTPALCVLATGALAVAALGRRPLGRALGQ